MYIGLFVLVVVTDESCCSSVIVDVQFTDKQQQQSAKVTKTAIHTKILRNLCTLIFVLLLLLLLCCGCTMTDDQQQNYAVTTTQRTKRSIYIHILCNFQLRRQITVRHILLRCTSLVEASGGQEEYYIRSS